MASEAVFLTLHLFIFFLHLVTLENEIMKKLFFDQFICFKCFFNICIVLTAVTVCHVYLSDFVFFLEILDPSCSYLEGSFILIVDVEKPGSLFSLLIEIKEERK
jgi:hypothetical protein